VQRGLAGDGAALATNRCEVRRWCGPIGWFDRVRALTRGRRRGEWTAEPVLEAVAGNSELLADADARDAVGAVGREVLVGEFVRGRSSDAHDRCCFFQGQEVVNGCLRRVYRVVG